MGWSKDRITKEMALPFVGVILALAAAFQTEGGGQPTRRQMWSGTEGTFNLYRGMEVNASKRK